MHGLSRHKPGVSERQSFRFASRHALGTPYLFHGPAHHRALQSERFALSHQCPIPLSDSITPSTAKELSEAVANSTNLEGINHDNSKQYMLH